MQLTLVRHANAVPAVDGMKDFHRPLSPEGREEGRVAAQRFISGSAIKPDLLLASPAVRTLETAHIFALELGYDPDRIQTADDLYPGSLRAFEEVVRELDPVRVRHVMVFGHNPGISEFAYRLDPGRRNLLPTAGFLTITVEGR